MDSSGGPSDKATLVRNVSHVVFAVTTMALGILGLIKGNFAPIWQPTPKDIPVREPLVYLCGFISLICGIGLLWQRTATVAARVLLIYLLIWLLLFRVVHIFVAPTSQDSWSGFAETAVIVAGAWVVYVWFAADWERKSLAFAVGDSGLRIARTLFGLVLIIFGLAHLRYPKETSTLVPEWLPSHVALAYFTGVSFIAAGGAVLVSFWARLAATLSALQLALFTVLVWVPIVAKGSNSFQWSEFVISVTVTAGAWVVADSYRGTPWFAVSKR